MSIKKGYWNSNALANPAMRSRDDSYSNIKLSAGESWDIDSAMTNIESSGSNKIHICTLNKDTYTDAAIDTLLENFGATLELTIDSSTFVITAILKNKDGTTLGTPQTIDLPLESVIVSGSYDNATKSLILTLENGNTITIPIADLISGLQSEITAQNPLDADLVNDSTSAHKFVTATEKTNWNNHIANTNNPHSVTKAQVGLGNVDNTSDLNKPISTATQTALNGKQATISDLATIRSNAQAGKAASDTIATYGNIVTHNVSEFATAAQGGKADTAVQPGDLATVATSGDYDDLINKPTLGTAAAANTTDFATAAQGALADTALQAADLVNYVTTNTTQTISGEKVFSGIMNYSAGKTYILAGNGGTKLGYWSYDVDGGSNITLQTMTASTRNINFKTNNGGKVTYNGSEIAKVSAIPTAVSQLTNDSGYITNAVNDLVNYTLTSSLATVATTGDYGDLINTPTIPAAQVNSDWNANSGVAEILNKPTLGTMAAESASDYTPTANLATVATSGLYSDLSGTPTIPTTLAGLTGDVSISSPSNGDYLVYNSTSQKWENTASAATVSWGNITGTLADQTDLQTALNTFVTKGHEVIAFQEPNAGNNYTWYRKYADGWVEQGGIIAQATSAEVNLNFPVIMADTNYGWGLNISYNDTNPTGGRLVSAWNFTTTGMTARCDTNFKKYWRVEGMAA